MKLHGAKTQAAAEFYDWFSEQGYELAFRPEGKEFLRPLMRSKDDLLASWKGIDLQACEKEHQAILDDFLKRQNNEN